MYVQGISSSLSGSAGPYNPFPSGPEPDSADIMGMTIGAVVRNPMDKVLLSTSRDTRGQITSDAVSGPKDQGPGNSVTGLLSGSPQSPADLTAGTLISAQNAESAKAIPGAAEQIFRQEQNAAAGSVSITDLQSVNLLTMMPDMVTAAIRHNRYIQNSPAATGTRVDAIV